MADYRLYRDTLNTEDVIGAATVALVPGQYVTVGELVVKADELVGMGYGSFKAQDQADGRIFADFKDGSSNDIEGKFRIIMLSSQNIPVGASPVVLDVDCAALRAGNGSRPGQIPFNFNDILLSKDKKFSFQIMNTAASAQTVSKANSSVLMDITRALI